MAYQTYTTDALICGTFDRNTADRSYLLFTRDAGMLYATARSAREEKSRQRYALQDFSLVRVSLVKGKTGWKIGSIEVQKNYYHAAVDKAARGSVVGWFRFLRRFVGGEDVQAALFAHTLAVLEVLANAMSDRAYGELVAKVTALHQLGYVAPAVLPTEVLTAPVTAHTSQPSDIIAKQLEQLYAQAERASHL